MRGELPPHEAAQRYEEELHAFFGPDEPPILDLILLGMGDNGHTASLFPGSPALDAPGLCAAVHDAPKPPPERITLTLRALRAARMVLFLVTGPEKATAVAGLLGPPHPDVPASLIAGPRAELIADRDALPRRG
jgi:6-phosphogluconolactonase